MVHLYRHNPDKMVLLMLQDLEMLFISTEQRAVRASSVRLAVWAMVLLLGLPFAVVALGLTLPPGTSSLASP